MTSKFLGFKRNWDSSCPRVWDTWEVNGTKYIIQDLSPEDDEKALQIIQNYFLPEETLNFYSGIQTDPQSALDLCDFYKKIILPVRTTLACYAKKGNQQTLVGVNLCLVKCKDDDESIVTQFIRGEKTKRLWKAVELIDSKWNMFEYLDEDQVLYAYGLVVVKEYRGIGIATRILAAREPLCQLLGVKATATTFTSPLSARIAIRNGFKTVFTVKFDELADAGLDFPRNDTVIAGTSDVNQCRLIEMMVKKFE